MTTDFSAGTIPPLYRKIYETCSTNGEPIHKDVFQNLLLLCNLDQATLKTIWNLTGPSQGSITRTNLYKALALVAWAQDGKVPSDKLFENFSGKEYPTPDLGDLTPIQDLKSHLESSNSPALLGLTFFDIKQLDSICVELAPEKKGLFIKHSEYIVSSRRFSTKVTRRYNDFIALYELLLARFPYRLVPRLPPKKIVSDSHFLESRRRGLQRWLTLVCRHPTMCHDAVVSFFITDQGSDIQHRIRDIFRRAPDEFMTSDIAATAKNLLPSDSSEFAASREQVRTLAEIVGRIKQIADTNVERTDASVRDSEDLAAQLRALGSANMGHVSTGQWKHMQEGFVHVAEEIQSLPSKAHQHSIVEQVSVCEALGLLTDVLIAHRELCERLERGLAHDHQAALAKMLSLKKRKIQGVIRGTDTESVEQLEAKMMTQENIISNMELRSDFSLYCVHMETQLVHAYLETLSSILNNLVNLRIREHSELAEVWKQVNPTFKRYFGNEKQASNGTSNI